MSTEPLEIVDEFVELPLEQQKERLNMLVGQQQFDDIALLLESLPLEERFTAWQFISAEGKLPILLEMRTDPRTGLLEEMQISELDELFDGIDADALIELADSLPEYLLDRAFTNLDETQRGYFELAQRYDEEQIAHWADHNVLVSPQNVRVLQAMRLLRRELPNHSEVVYLMDRTGRYSGCIKLIDLVGAGDHLELSELKIEDYPELEAEAPLRESADKVVRSGYSALPILTENNRLIGRLDVENASDILRDEYEGQFMAQAGLSEEEDLFAAVGVSAARRALWLGLNLLTAFLAAWFIGLFQYTLEQVVALAVLLPVVASMGGIAGSQTLTLIIRGLALGQISKANLVPLLKKELGVGSLNGVLWAVVIGIIASLWFSNSLIGVVIALAVVANIMVAAVSGVLIPVLLDKLEIDPALSGSVILTTVTDVVGFVTFLGLGTLLLLPK